MVYTLQWGRTGIRKFRAVKGSESERPWGEEWTQRPICLPLTTPSAYCQCSSFEPLSFIPLLLLGGL